MSCLITPVRIYPIGEFCDGSRLCASVGSDQDVQWFSEHKNFDLQHLYGCGIEVPPALDSSDFIVDSGVCSERAPVALDSSDFIIDEPSSPDSFPIPDPSHDTIDDAAPTLKEGGTPTFDWLSWD